MESRRPFSAGHIVVLESRLLSSSHVIVLVINGILPLSSSHDVVLEAAPKNLIFITIKIIFKFNYFFTAI